MELGVLGTCCQTGLNYIAWLRGGNFEIKKWVFFSERITILFLILSVCPSLTSHKPQLGFTVSFSFFQPPQRG